MITDIPYTPLPIIWCTVNGDDYKPSSTELSFSIEEQQLLQPGESIVKCIDVDIIDDEWVEGEHVFTVQIESVSPSSVVQCSPDSVTIHIIDDDG